jgi:hypothetical protein
MYPLDGVTSFVPPPIDNPQNCTPINSLQFHLQRRPGRHHVISAAPLSNKLGAERLICLRVV